MPAYFRLEADEPLTVHVISPGATRLVIHAREGRQDTHFAINPGGGLVVTRPDRREPIPDPEWLLVL